MRPTRVRISRVVMKYEIILVPHLVNTNRNSRGVN